MLADFMQGRHGGSVERLDSFWFPVIKWLLIIMAATVLPMACLPWERLL